MFLDKLNGDVGINGVAKLLVTNRTNENVPSGLVKYQISGIVISGNNIPEITGNYSMMECDIIIIPKRIHSGAQNSLNKSMTSDQMLVSGYDKIDNWKETKIL